MSARPNRGASESDLETLPRLFTGQGRLLADRMDAGAQFGADTLLRVAYMVEQLAAIEEDRI